MKRATLTETKNHLSALIDRIRHGETVLILDHGRPVARLVPVLTEESEAPQGRVVPLLIEADTSMPREGFQVVDQALLLSAE